ncbi:MAG TPA: ABC transporter permease [Acidobacteriaceae bacterium]|jgi:predicted permease
MSAVRRLFTRMINLVSGGSDEARLREELETHLAAETEDNVRAGMAPGEARRRARLKLGTVEAVRESYHAEASLPLLENLWLDIRYALRVLRKSRSFTAVAVITLMLGIGANVVVFGVVNSILLHPLEVNQPQNLYQIRHKPWMSGRLLTTSYPALEDYRRRNTTFSGLIGINAYSSARLNWRNTRSMLQGMEVTGNYFDVLGVQPQLGSFFHETEEHGAGSAAYVVLSDPLWRNTFGADPNIVGTTIELNQQPVTVMGVAPAQFHGTERFALPDYWLPMMNEAQLTGADYLRNRASVSVTVIGRLKPGVTPEQATADLNRISAELAREYPSTDDGQGLRLIHPGLIGDEGDVIRGFLLSVTVLALLVLAAACANLASLFAARAADRSRELALRVALGSSRRRLVRQLFTEAFLLALLGGAAGMVGAQVLLRLLNSLTAWGHLDLRVDARVYLAGAGLTLVSALLSGLIPARQALRSSPMQMMKSGVESVHLGRFALRDVLLGAQIAICTLLVTAAMVAARGLERTLHAPLGFQPQGAMLAEVDFSLESMTADAALAKRKAMLDAARNVPGVTAAAIVSRTPMTGGMRGVPVYAPGTTDFRLKNSELAPYVFSMSPGFFAAAGTRLLSGRDVDWHDTSATPNVAVVNATFAQKLWPRTAAIGQHFILRGKLTEVVGIVQDGKYHDLQEPPQAVAYIPMTQSDDGATILVVRSQLPPNEEGAVLQHALSSVDANALISVQTWEGTLNGELFPARAATVALGVMGLLAAMLAVTGIFGMAAYSVSRRMKELGIRVALGARRMQVMSAAVGRPIVLLVAGSSVGLLTGIFASRLLARIVYQANPGDPAIVGGAVLTMALLGLVAAAIPARRALSVDPSKLMREE